ncbi:MAG: CDC27 family protein [Methanotrichaceae archaeon]|nr:CDC27 family protein [Methanotrichaceae archaeon]
MTEIPQSIRFTIEDKLEKQTESIAYSQEKAAKRIAANAELNTTRELIGIKNVADEIGENQFRAVYAVKQMVEKNTNRIINSSERNTDRIIDGLDQIYMGIEDLNALFDWKLSEMIWILEQQRKDFKKIIEILQKPLTTQAKELRERAEFAYENMLILEAIRDFEESINLNPYYFACYQSLGNIYFFQKRDLKKALGYYEKAVRYAIPRSNYYASIAFLHIGLSNYHLGHYQEAYGATSNAIRSYPKLSEAYFQHAQYCSKLGKYDEALGNLRIAIDIDRRYCLKTLSEEDFAPMSRQLKNFFTDLTNETKSRAEVEIEKASRLIEKFNSIDALNEAKKKIDEAINLKQKGNYFSCRDAIYKTYVSQKMIIGSMTNYISQKIPKLEYRLSELKKDKKNLWANMWAIPPESIKIPGVHKQILSIVMIDLVVSGVLYLFFTIYSAYLMNWLYFGFIIMWILSLHDFYVMIEYEKKWLKIKNESDIVESGLAECCQVMALIESEKDELNIRFATNLNAEEYKKYLAKNYG